MIYKKYEHPSYNVIGIKSDRYKSCLIEVIFNKNITKHDLVERSLLTDTLCNSTKNYPIKKDLTKKYQDLYNMGISPSVNKLGSMLQTSFSCGFLNPKYTNEKDYLESVIKMLFDVICKPNIVNNSFDLKSFNICKKQLSNDILEIKEDPNKVSISNALKKAFKNSPTSYVMMDEKDYLDDISPDKLYSIYQNMLENDLCNIFVVGDIDIDLVNDLISKYFINKTVKTSSVNLYVENNLNKKTINYEEEGSFVQSNLIMIYNINKLDKKDMQITPYVFNNIFGNGSLNSKLFNYLREKNSLCYGVSCLYLRFDGILVIKVSLAYNNIKKAQKLINKALKEMVNGKFTKEELEDAKKSSIYSIKINEDYIDGLLNNYIFNYYDDLPVIDERIQIIRNLNKKDIMHFASSLKLNSTYILKEEANEEH